MFPQNLQIKWKLQEGVLSLFIILLSLSSGVGGREGVRGCCRGQPCLLLVTSTLSSLNPCSSLPCNSVGLPITTPQLLWPQGGSMSQV